MKYFLIVLGLVLAVVALTVGVVQNYQIDRDINGWKDRAQVSSEPNDMLVWMTNVKDGMEHWGMTSGSSALIFQTPENDMSLIYKTVLNHVDQAQVLTKMDRSSPQYQTGLDNLRGSIRELNLHTHDYWNVHQGLGFWILGFIGLVLLVVGVGWWYVEY